MTDELPDDEFLFVFPAYSYLIEPGPRPGFLRIPGTETVFVPLWTDSDSFLTYIERSGMAGKFSGLTFYNAAELVFFLRSIPKQIDQVMVDPLPKAPARSSVFRVSDLIERLSNRTN